MGRKLLHLLNGMITCAVVLVLILAGAYAGYALWDNQQIYDAAENVLSEVKEMRASLGIPTTLSAMEELLEENRKAREAKAAAAAQGAVSEETAVIVPPAAAETSAVFEASADTDNTDAGTEVVPAETNATAETSTTVETVEAAEVPAEQHAEAAENSAAAEIPATVAESVPAVTPEPTEEPDSSPIGQLKAINPDITAWLMMPGTAIDYPVLQGTTNYSYINTDVYGNFALAGSIFLDSRNKEDYTDIYSLLYGHNMAQHRMFSDLNLYKEETFFDEYTLGMLLMPDGCHVLESLSILVVPASDSGLFNPENWTYLDGEEIYSLTQENALFTCEKGLEALRKQIDAGETPRLVALSTCSDEFTDARTILLTLMDP